METWIWIVIGLAIAGVAVTALAAWSWSALASRRRRSARLKAEFGPEYDATTARLGRRHGEDDLEARKARVAQLDISSVPGSEAERLAVAWTATQARFVDEPAAALADADRLLSEVMQLRGYPIGDFERRAADASVAHPEAVSNYRSAHSTALAHEAGDATTEELRQALIQARTLFRELLDSGRAEPDARRTA